MVVAVLEVIKLVAVVAHLLLGQLHLRPILATAGAVPFLPFLAHQQLMLAAVAAEALAELLALAELVVAGTVLLAALRPNLEQQILVEVEVEVDLRGHLLMVQAVQAAQVLSSYVT